jgi:hypothetical protein
MSASFTRALPQIQGWRIPPGEQLPCGTGKVLPALLKRANTEHMLKSRRNLNRAIQEDFSQSILEDFRKYRIRAVYPPPGD